ncbi:MAG: MerR family transcriptional regulator [Deltaproteobacteria bacterium]|nr:MerR family transcriptional regulator [Deltaproteobacteria bacterium]
MPKRKITRTNWMRIKELIEESGVSRHNIHYYLREGLLPPPVKSGKTMSLYTDIHVEALKYIRTLREEHHMPIAGIRREVKLRFAKYWNSPEAIITTIHKRKDATKGEKQKERIIEKAIELFSSKGYHSVHINHITDALNISKGTFYIYFTNKEDLLVTVFEHLVREMTNIEKKISNIDDIIIRMRERARSYFNFHKKYSRIFEIIRAESIGKKNLTRVNIKTIYNFIIDLIAADLIKATDIGLPPIAKKDPRLMAHIIFGGFDFTCYSQIIGLSKHSLTDIIEFFFLTFIRNGNHPQI